MRFSKGNGYKRKKDPGIGFWNFKLALILLALPAIMFAQPGPSEDPYFIQGVEQYNQGDYVLARESFTTAIGVFPESGQAYFYRAYCSMYLHDVKAARPDLLMAQKLLGKDDPYVLIGFGYLYNESAEYKKAVKYLDRAVDVDHTLADAYNNRGISYQGLRRYKEAIRNYTMALQYDSTLSLAYNNRGTAIYYNQDVAAPHRTDIEMAIRDFTKALQLTPDLCLAMRNRGLAYSFLEKYTDAVSDLTKAIECDPQNALNYLSRGVAKAKMNMYNDAINDFQNALEIDKDLPDAYIEMGSAKAKMGDYEGGLNDQFTALAMDRSYAGLAYYNIACIKALTEDKEGMIVNLKKAKKEGYFNSRFNVQNFSKDEDFKEYRRDEDFIKFTRTIKSKANQYFSEEGK
ncbi:MAG: tetratricopeptide repeat protein [Bacteroidota bacterium]|nr:tetratricopeptide repeat protein [Bacteroidota bacterium]